MSSKKKSKASTVISSRETTEAQPAPGFSQFGGEGPLFHVRQFGGFFLVVFGVMILATSYSEHYKLIPISANMASYLSLAVIIAGAIIHECRPFKVGFNTTHVNALLRAYMVEGSSM
jgi:apolipoprotein N-acyltransferase